MKKLINFSSWIVLLFLCVGFSSCSKDDDGNNDSNDDTANTFYIKAKINDENYSSSVGTSSSGNKLSISGISLDEESYIIMISFPIDITVGTYDLSDDVWFGDYKASLWDSSNDYHSSNNGSITITEYDTTKGLIKGTFQFTIEGYIITNGEFYAELP